MTEQQMQLSELERNTLLMLAPYERGVTLDLAMFREEVVRCLTRLAERGFCGVEATASGMHHLQLLAAGQEICGTPGVSTA